MSIKRAKEIALAFPRGAHQEVFITGVLRYAIEHGCNWSYVTAPESLALSVLDLRGWRGDGIIAALNTPAEAACVKELKIPIVNISGTLPKTPVPRVSLDNGLVGQTGGRASDRARFSRVRVLRAARRGLFGGSARRRSTRGLRRPATEASRC